MFQQRVAPFYRTLTTTTDQQTSLLAGSDRLVLGMRQRASHRLRHHRYPRRRGTVARSWTPDWTRRTCLRKSNPWAHNQCWERLVNRPHLLGESAQGINYLTSVKLKGRKNRLRIMMNEKRKVKMMKKSKKSGRKLNSCIHGDDHGMEWDNHSHMLSQCAMCKRWVWQHRTDYEDCNTKRTLTCSCCALCWFSGSCFSRCHWCRMPQRPARCFHSSTTFSPRKDTKYKFLSFWMLWSDYVLSPSTSICIPNYWIFSHRETGSFEMLYLNSNDELEWPCSSFLLMWETWLELACPCSRGDNGSPIRSSIKSSAFHSWEVQALSLSHPD